MKKQRVTLKLQCLFPKTTLETNQLFIYFLLCSVYKIEKGDSNIYFFLFITLFIS